VLSTRIINLLRLTILQCVQLGGAHTPCPRAPSALLPPPVQKTGDVPSTRQISRTPSPTSPSEPCTPQMSRAPSPTLPSELDAPKKPRRDAKPACRLEKRFDHASSNPGLMGRAFLNPFPGTLVSNKPSQGLPRTLSNAPVTGRSLERQRITYSPGPEAQSSSDAQTSAYKEDGRQAFQRDRTVVVLAGGCHAGRAGISNEISPRSVKSSSKNGGDVSGAYYFVAHALNGICAFFK